MVNCQPVQIIIYIEETLNEYYAKVKGKKCNVLEILDLPNDFSWRCPICGGKECAEFIGYYFRTVIDERGTYYRAFPVGRFLCRSKGGKPTVKHRTFSLLPYQLAPYTRYCIPFIIKVLKLRHIEEKSIYKLQGYLSASERVDNYIDLSTSRIYGFKELILQSIDKILAAGYYKEAEKALQEPGSGQRIKRFIEFAEDFCCSKLEQTRTGISPSIRGPCALSYDYYMEGGGYYGNSHFLFGTASQFRPA